MKTNGLYLYLFALVLIPACAEDAPDASAAEESFDAVEKTGASEEGVDSDSDSSAEQEEDAGIGLPDSGSSGGDGEVDAAFPTPEDAGDISQLDSADEGASQDGDAAGSDSSTETEADTLLEEDAEGQADGAVVPDATEEPLEPAEPPAEGELLLREVLIDGLSDGDFDPNRDGKQHPREDEFIELVNMTNGALDLGGVQLRERFYRAVPRHKFPEGFVLQPGNAVVVFGGGFPAKRIPGATNVVAAHNGPGADLGLHLTNSGNKIEVLSADNKVLDSLSYGDAGGVTVPTKGSLQRMPSGAWVPHVDVAPGGSSFSPGVTFEGKWYSNE